MGSLSIRGVDDELANRLKKEASAARKSVNQFVLELLKKQTGVQKPKRNTEEYGDLDHLFGKWSDAEFDRIEGSINAERRIDEELWR